MDGISNEHQEIGVRKTSKGKKGLDMSTVDVDEEMTYHFLVGPVE
jgi:hypothetical protein